MLGKVIMIKRIKENASLLSIITLLGFMLCVYAPYEMYLLNKEELWFRLNLFWWIPIVVGIVAMVLGYIVGICLKGKIKLIYEAILFAIAIAAYVQGNFLNLKLGVLNGAEIKWSDYSKHFMINIFVWIAILISVILFAWKKTKLFSKVSRYVSLFLAAMQFVTLCVLLIPELLNGGAIKEDYRFVSDKGLYETNDQDSIMVFILDMYDDRYFREILEKEPEWKEKMDGFTYFQNSTGMYSTTNYSMSHLATGKVFKNEKARGIWVNEVESYIDYLIEDGYRIYLYTDMLSAFPDRVVEKSENYIYAPLKISSNLHFTYDLYQLVMCKYFPDMIKPYIWMDGTEIAYWKEYDAEDELFVVDNLNFIEDIRDEGIIYTGENKSFKFIHLEGTHYPYKIGADMQPVDENSLFTYDCALGVLKMVQSYMDELKEKGTYDNTSIIITADHGYYWDGTLCSPVFLAKPKNAEGDLKISNAPITQTDLAATVLEFADIETNEFGRSVFEIEEGEERERYFYQYYLAEDRKSSEYRLIEYKIDSESNHWDGFRLTDVEYTEDGKKIKHSDYCKTCKGIVPGSNIEYDPPQIIHYKDDNYPQ